MGEVGALKETFSFPETVNEYSARLVATGVVLMALDFAFTRNPLMLAALAFGFVARVLTGPTLSPLGQVVTRWITPGFEALIGRAGREVPGAPKRFAQGIGATVSLTALVLHLTGFTTAALIAVVILGCAATLESAFGFCLGCVAFAKLMAIGVIPESACEDCNDISGRLARAT